MARDSFQIRFDKYGNLLVEDAEFAERLVYKLIHERKLTIMLDVARSDPSRALPNYVECLIPMRVPCPDGIRPPPPNKEDCPMKMCECDFDLIDLRQFKRQWEHLSDPRPGLGERPDREDR